jgi:hypothetical protein
MRGEAETYINPTPHSEKLDFLLPPHLSYSNFQPSIEEDNDSDIGVRNSKDGRYDSSDALNEDENLLYADKESLIVGKDNLQKQVWNVCTRILIGLMYILPMNY